MDEPEIFCKIKSGNTELILQTPNALILELSKFFLEHAMKLVKFRFVSLMAVWCMLGLHPALSFSPQHEITVIVAYDEGSGTDLSARIISKYAGKFLWQFLISTMMAIQCREW